MEVPNEQMLYGQSFGTEMGTVRWDVVARGLGCEGLYAESLAEVDFFFSSRRRHTRSLCDWSSDGALPIYVLTRQAQTGGLRHRSVSKPQDVAPPLGEAVELEREAVVEEASFDPDVELLRDLPGDVRVGCPRLKDAVHRLVDAEDVPAADAVGSEVLPLVDPVVTRLAPRGAELQVVEQRDVLAEERPFRNAPSRRDAGEEAEALIGREDVRAVVTRDELEEVLVLEGVVETSEIVLPRRNEGAATVVLLGITAGVDLVDLIRDVVLPEGTDVLAVRGLSLHAAQDPDRVRPDVAAVLGDEIQEDTRTPPVILVELGSAISPRSGQQYRLAVRVARLIGPGVERPGRPPLLLGPEEVVVGRIATQRQTADPRHLEVHAQRALDVVSLVLVVSRRRGRDHDRVVSELDVGSRQPVRPVRGQVGLAAHERAKDVARAPVREIGVLEATPHVEPQAQVVRDPAVAVAAEAVLVVPGGAVAVVAVLGQTAQREVIPDPLPAAPQGDVPPSLQRPGLDDRAEPVGVGREPGIGARRGLLTLARRVGGWQVAVHVDLVEHRHVRRGVRHLGNPRGVVDALIDSQRELRWLRGTATPALRGDEDDAVGRAGAVDRR